MLCSHHCAGLHESVVTGASPGIHDVELVGVLVGDALDVVHGSSPVAGDLGIYESRTQPNSAVVVIVYPIVGAAGVLAVGLKVLLLVGGKVEPAGSPGDVVLHALVGVGHLLRGHFAVFRSKIVKGNSVFQVLLAAEVDVALSQSRSVLSSNIAGAVSSGVGLVGAVIPHFLGILPDTVVTSVVAYLVNEVRNVAASVQSCAVAEKSCELVRDVLDVGICAGLLEIVGVLIVHPAQS